MGHLLLPAPRRKMYLTLLRPLLRPSTFNSIYHYSSSCSVDNTLSDGVPYHSSLVEPPYTRSSLGMLPVSTCVRLSRFELSSISTNPTLIQLYQELGRAAVDIKKGFSSLKATKGTQQYKRYKELHR